jgi:hypothetical protein
MPSPSFIILWLRWYRFHILAVVFILLLLAKFLWPLVMLHMPLGYDVGIYRYLFERYGTAMPPLSLPDLPDWAREHPLGLFVFSSALMKIGVPSDWLIGWIWNLMPVCIIAVFAWIFSRRPVFGKSGPAIGVLILLMGFLSHAFFDGFAAMYWKTFAGLLFMIIAFYCLERKSLWAVLWGLLTVITHHQTGLLFGLSVCSWFIASFLMYFTDSPDVTSKLSPQQSLLSEVDKSHALLSPSQMVVILITCLAIFGFGLVWYIPIWEQTVLRQLPSLFNLEQVVGGNFPEPLFYLRSAGILLALGVGGFIWSFKSEQWTLWHFAVLWSALFVVFKLFFYRRFMLQLDFFLLPFAAFAVREVWARVPWLGVRLLVVILIVVQGYFSVKTILHRVPIVDASTFRIVEELSAQIPEDSFVIALEDQSAMVLRGWLPHHHVGGAGLFELVWSYEDWERFLIGTHQQRSALLRRVSAPASLFVSPQFLQYYGENAKAFLADPCFEETEVTYVFDIVPDCLNGG